MEKVKTQAAVKVTSFETSRTRRSLVDGNIHSEDSNNVSDEEYASSGFYVREKSNDKKVADKSTPNSPKPVLNGENTNDVESNSSSEKNEENTNNEENNPAPQEKITNGDNNIVDENVTNEQVDTVASVEVSDNENRQENIPNEEQIPQVTSQQAPDPLTENLFNETADNLIEDETCKTNNESEPSEQNQSDSTSKTDEENLEKAKNEEVLHEETETTNKIIDEEAVDTAEKEDPKQANEAPVDDSSQVPPEKSNDEGVTDDKEKDKIESEDNAEKESQKETDCDVLVSSEKKVRTEAEKNDMLGAVELTPKSEEPVDVDLTNDDSEAKSKDTTEKDSSILKSHLSKSSEAEDQDGEIEDDFDPSLFCPDISMDVDEAPVVTNENHIPDDGSTSPLLYQPIFSTLVDEITGAEVQVDLTPEEMEIRRNMYGPDNPVQKSKVHCTACNVHLGSAMTGANNRFVHPLLKVLICKNCYHFYTSGEFEKDEDGSELYCRWCGQGGQVLCCSSCEFVFCKRCIRNNFGVKKFKEIRNSDDWNCFRCDPGQLSNLRASCAEFMEYYRTELARAYSLSSTNPELMTTDYTTCCSTPAIKKEETTPSTNPRPRRKRKDEDPDYSPMALSGEPPAKKPVLTSGPGYTVISNPSMVVRPIAPKPLMPVGNLRPVGSGNIRAQLAQTFKVGNTVFRSKGPYSVQRPNDGGKNSTGYVTISSTSAAKTGTPGYIKLAPSSRMPNPNRVTGKFSMASGSAGPRQTFTPVRAAKLPSTMPTMKHEWFEKTVRAAARVNSNLSYTLTQLNRQQSQAANVESLAVVHNKLQEVLSTTINSLIQIRKNLRSEFISGTGIRNVKFPPKPAVVPPSSAPIVVKDDDDVIFVSQPSTTQAATATPPPLLLSPSVTLSKAKPSSLKLKPGNLVKIPSSVVTSMNRSKNSSPASGITTTPNTGRTTGFLKVRSLTALQNVPSECIIIPDDPPEPHKPTETYPKEPLRSLEPQEVELTSTSDDTTIKETSQTNNDPNSKNNVFNVLMVYNVLKKPSPQIREMMNAVVNLERSPEIDKLITKEEDISQ